MASLHSQRDSGTPSDAPPARAPNAYGPGSWLVVTCAATKQEHEYRIDSTLGTGGMATVYGATRRDGPRLALKILARDFAEDARVRGRFYRERDLAARVDHPARVPISIGGTTGAGEPVLVMELVDGENVEMVRRRLGGKLPMLPALRVVEDVLDFLVACHAAGVLHLDIKTANILWTPSRAVRVVDFGIAHCAELDTPPDMTLGTPSFMAPEQAAGRRDADARADVYSSGAVLYTLLVGRRLHRAGSHDESLDLAASRPAPKLAEDEDHSLPEEIVAVVDRALSFEREARFPDAASMRDAVRTIRERIELRLSGPSRSWPSYGDLDDGLAEGTPIASSGSISAASRVPDAKGNFAETPLPHLLTHVLARALTGTLVVQNGDQREAVEFVEGSPIRKSPSAADDPIVGVLARVASMPPEATYRFYIDDRETRPAAWTRVEPLEAILVATRRLLTQAPFAARVDATLGRMGSRVLALHPAAAPARFGLGPKERDALDAAIEYELTREQLYEANVAPRDVIDAMLYTLGITRHLATGLEGAWPIGVPKPPPDALG